MASKLEDLGKTANATGAVDIEFGAEPLGGFNTTVALGSATSATVRVEVRIGAEWLHADTIVLPDPTTGDTAKNVTVYPPYVEGRWNVTAIAGGSINLDAIGVGI